MTWNEQARLFTENSFEKAFLKVSGNNAEFNFNLVALLRDACMDAHSIAVSTKEYGVPIYPTLERFNYVINGVLQDGKWLLLDATSPNTSIGILSERAINCQGLGIIIRKFRGNIALSLRELSSQKP